MTDVLIIGSGAGGGPLAFTLARAGMKVVVLEKGPRHLRTDYSGDEIGVINHEFFLPSPVDEPHTLVTPKTTRPITTRLGWIATCLGGGTVHMGGFLYRFHPDDFRMASRFGNDFELADWPYDYHELEPYYSRAEWAVGMSGQAGANPFEGPRSRPYPMGPLAAHPFAARLIEALEHRGLHPFPTPRSVNSKMFQNRPACAYCDACSGFGCRIGAKGSTQETLLAGAEATSHCVIKTGATATEILVDERGHARGCRYRDGDGEEHEIEAKVVCVCCSAVESARLLLLSRSARFPDGLANGNGLVGRHLQFHAVTMGGARFTRRRFPELQTSEWNPFLGISAMDHYFLEEGISELAKGGLYRFDMMPRTPIANAQLLQAINQPMPWGNDLKSQLRDHFTNHDSVTYEVFHDYIPNAGTFTTLDPEVVDRWGIPVARIRLDPSDHHRQAGLWLTQRAQEVLSEMGGEQFFTTSVGGTSRYLVHGTCRAGVDPDRSVLDAYCRTHEVPNLFVVDGSFMPTSGGAPPTLTILANSFRTADHIVENAKNGVYSM